MEKLVVLVFFIGTFLTGTYVVSANENHNEESHHKEDRSSGAELTKHENGTKSGKAESNESEMDHSEMTEEEHQESLNQDGSNHHYEGNEESKDYSEDETVHGESNKGGHGGEEQVEQPANVKVLGTFGAINLSFIFIGIWNKWLRRKVEA